MRIDTALARKNRAIVQLRDLYSTARICGMPWADMNQAIANIKGTTLAKAPGWTREFFDGYRTALDAGLYEQSLMFGGFVDGVFYSTHRDRSDYYESNGIAPSEYADDGKVTGRGHYWKTTAAPKPFFLSLPPMPAAE